MSEHTTIPITTPVQSANAIIAADENIAAPEYLAGVMGSPLQPQSFYARTADSPLFTDVAPGGTSSAESLATGSSTQSNHHQRLVDTLRTPGRWSREIADIAIPALADALNIHILFREPLGHRSIGDKDARRTVTLQRFSTPHYEHYSLIDDATRPFSSFDGDSFFRVISQALHGDDRSCTQYRHLAASHVNAHFEDYDGGTDAISRFAITFINIENQWATLDSAFPAIKEKILSETLGLLITELHNIRDSVGTHPFTLQQKKRIREIASHFIVVENKERIESLIRLINANESDPQNAVVNNYRLHELRTRLEKSEDILKLKNIDALNGENEVDPESLLISLLNQDVLKLISVKGMSSLQLGSALHDAQLALMIDFYALVGVKSHALNEAINQIQLEGHAGNLTQVIAPALIGKVKNEFAHLVDRVRHYLPAEIGDHHMRDNTLAQHGDDYHPDNYDYQTPLEALLERGNAQEDEVIANRLLRLLEIRFLKRLPLLNLLENTVNNSLLLQEKSIVHEDEQKLFSEGHYAYPHIIDTLLDSRRERLAILLEEMPTAPLIIGDDFPVSEMSLEGLPYGPRGLSLAQIENWLADKSLSNTRLSCIGLYSCTAMHEITHTGSLDIRWMNNLHDSTLLQAFPLLPNPRLDHDADRFALIDTLVYVGREIEEPLQGRHPLGVLLDYSHRVFQQINGLSLTDNQLVYLLVTEYKDAILVIANRMYDEHGEDYSPLADWETLLVSVARDGQLAQKLENCPNEAFDIVNGLCEPALFRALALAKNIAIGKGFIKTNFSHYFNPAGERVYTPATLPDTYINIMPDSLFLISLPQPAHSIAGRVVVVPRHGGVSNLELLQDCIALDDKNAPAPGAAIAVDQQKRQAFLALVRQVADFAQKPDTVADSAKAAVETSLSIPESYAALKHQARFKRKRDDDPDNDGGASSSGIAGHTGRQHKSAATSAVVAASVREQRQSVAPHDTLVKTPQQALQLALMAEHAALDFHTRALSLIAAYEMLLTAARTATQSPRQAADVLIRNSGMGAKLATVRGYQQCVDQLLSYYFTLIHQLFSAQALTSKEVYALTLEHSPWESSPGTRALALINHDQYSTSVQFIHVMLAAGVAEGSHRELKQFLNTRTHDFAHPRTVMQSRRDGFNRIKHEARQDWSRTPHALSGQAQQIIALLSRHQLLDDERQIASLHKKNRVARKASDQNALAALQAPLLERMLDGQRALESSLSAEYLRLGRQEKHLAARPLNAGQTRHFARQPQRASLLEFIARLSDVLADYRRITAQASCASLEKDSIFERQENERRRAMNLAVEPTAPGNVVSFLMTEMLPVVTQPENTSSSSETRYHGLQQTESYPDSLSKRLAQLEVVDRRLKNLNDEDDALQALARRLGRLRDQKVPPEKAQDINKIIEQALDRRTHNDAAQELERLAYRTEMINQQVNTLKNKGLEQDLQRLQQFNRQHQTHREIQPPGNMRQTARTTQAR